MARIIKLISKIDCMTLLLGQGHGPYLKLRKENTFLCCFGQKLQQGYQTWTNSSLFGGLYVWPCMTLVQGQGHGNSGTCPKHISSHELCPSCFFGQKFQLGLQSWTKNRLFGGLCNSVIWPCMTLAQGSISSMNPLRPISTEKLPFKENAVDFKILSGMRGLKGDDVIVRTVTEGASRKPMQSRKG